MSILQPSMGFTGLPSPQGDFCSGFLLEQPEEKEWVGSGFDMVAPFILRILV